MSAIYYTVVLLNNGTNISNKVQIVKIVMHSLQIPMKKAKELVDEVPCVLAEDIPENIAYALKQEIEANNGQINLIANEESYMPSSHVSLDENISDISFQENATKAENSDNASMFSAPGSESIKVPVFSAPGSESVKTPAFSRLENDSSKDQAFNMSEERISKAPSFKAPESGVLQFTASKGESSRAPQFSAPNGSSNDAPIFATPEQQNNESDFSRVVQPRYNDESCFYHPHNRAVIKCHNCGKPICGECREAGELTDGSYVCYDCASAIVQNDVDIAKAKRGKILARIIMGIVGAIVLGILSITGPVTTFFEGSGNNISIGVWRLLIIMFGAALPIYIPALRKLLSWIWRFIRWSPISSNGIIGTIFWSIKIMLVIFAFVGFITVFAIFLEFSPAVATILGIVDFAQYRKANSLVLRNQEILQHLSDRMEYIRIQSEENADNEALANDARMQNNHFAQAVRREGYAGASKMFSDEAREMTENDRKIKKFVLNEYGEVVRAA